MRSSLQTSHRDSYSKSNRSVAAPAFTLIELMVVISIIGVLASLLLPALSRAQQSAENIRCLNNIRQLGVATRLYATDHRDRIPPRADGSTNNPRWPHALFAEYQNERVLTCPKDGPETPASLTNQFYREDSFPRSYIINGCNDQFGTTINDVSLNSTMRLDAAKFPSETLLFGEKKNASFHYYMDLFEGLGNDFDELEQSRHLGRSSNYYFMDGSARSEPLWSTVGPNLNLWAITETGRTNYAFSFTPPP